jgi:hypothetical protein
MATNSTEAAKPEEPKGFLDKIGAALPVGLTALATAFAGMSTSELQRAMYWKSQAAQDQSRVTNQWTYAGFKRDRALIMQTTAAQLRAAGGYAPANFSNSSLPPLKGKPEDSEAEQKAQAKALEWLLKKNVDPSPLPELKDEQIRALLKAIKEREPEAEQLRMAGRIRMPAINEAIDAAEKKSEEYDSQWGPILKAATEIASYAEDAKGEAAARLRTARQAAGYDLEERRYRAESFINQSIGYLYEVRVKVTSAESDKHRHKSELFFYAMLAAQIGATVSALALARRTKSLLWLFASLTGIVALGIGAYVYLAT